MFRFVADAHVEDDLDHGMQNMTTNVIAETYHVLRLTLGHDFDTLASVTVIVMLWQMLKQLQATNDGATEQERLQTISQRIRHRR